MTEGYSKPQKPHAVSSSNVKIPTSSYDYKLENAKMSVCLQKYRHDMEVANVLRINQ